jgi:hypothetical protein
MVGKVLSRLNLDPFLDLLVDAKFIDEFNLIGITITNFFLGSLVVE